MTDINTGSATTDRILKNAMYAQKLGADYKAIDEYNKMNQAAATDAAKFNVQGKQTVDTINEQTRAIKNSLVGSALTNVGTMGQALQDYSNAQATNRITLSTLNSLSRYYGININALKNIMKNEPAKFDQLMVGFKGNTTDNGTD